MKNIDELSKLVEKFFTDWLVNQKKASPNTIIAYRDTFQLLLSYLAQRLKKGPNQLVFSDLNADSICDFLADLVENRKVSGRTRNARLSAIKSFFHYVANQDPSKNAFINRVLAIPKSRIIKRQVHFLTSDELEALLRVQDLKTWVGRRDHVLILVAAETGLRLSELISLRWEDVYLAGAHGYIKCIGKGRKERGVPFSSFTGKNLKTWRMEMSKSDFIFPNNNQTKMNPDCFRKRLEKYARLAESQCSSLIGKKITPHMLRHTAAMNLVQSDVDLSTIAIILGHESIETTQVYLEANMKMLEEVLSKSSPKSPGFKRFKADNKLMKFLKRL